MLEAIARSIQSNIRELEGALTRVIAFADLSNQPITLHLVEVALADMLPQRTSVEPQEVVNVVASVFGVEKAACLAASAPARWPCPGRPCTCCAKRSTSRCRRSAKLGGRDHTTVMYACEKIADQIERDDRLRRQVMQIREQLFGRQLAA